MLTNVPILSIITVIYNNVNIIEPTITSIIEQPDSHFEYIIIDGGSTDGTVEIIKKYSDKITYWVSEADKGIYDAMNKGIKVANGKYLVFVNSGDLLLKIPFKNLIHIDCDLAAFPVKLSTGSILYPTAGLALKIKNTLPHQGCFYRNDPELIYDTTFKVFADFHLNQRMYKNEKRIIILKSPVVAFHDIGGISHDKKYGREIFDVVKDNYGNIYKIISLLYFKMQGLKFKLKAIFK